MIQAKNRITEKLSVYLLPPAVSLFGKINCYVEIAVSADTRTRSSTERLGVGRMKSFISGLKSLRFEINFRSFVNPAV